MYFSKCILKNNGPLENIEIDLNNSKQPLILVGENGSGKSIFISYIVDALYEFGKQAYCDLIGSDAVDKYFRCSGSINQNLNTLFAYSLIQFKDSEKIFNYFEKTGTVNIDEIETKYSDFFTNLPISNTIDNFKTTTNSKVDFKMVFRENVICYFPASRFEKPHWLNDELYQTDETFDFAFKITGKIKKPIICEKMSSENKKWIMDVFLDSYVDLEQTKDGLSIAAGQNVNINLLFKQARRNIEKVLSHITGNDNAILAINLRSSSVYRLCVKDKATNQIIVPSLDHFSSGQAVLFNMFCTIIRYADIGDIFASHDLRQIKGIVLIDEIDLHLHTDLQYNALPALIKEFSNVQFIISTHSPLFILGMEKLYSDSGENISILEMPYGNLISAERFLEFKKAYEFFSNTKAFQDNILNEVAKQIELLKSSNKKAVLYTEGKTDIAHIQKAWDILYNYKEMPFEIFTLNGADNIKQFLISYSMDQIDKIVIGLLDYDEKGIGIIKKLSDNFVEIDSSIYKRKVENGTEKSAYIITLPTPTREYVDYVQCPIEFLYKKELLARHNIINKRHICKIMNLDYVKKNELFFSREEYENKLDLWFYEVVETSISKNEFAEFIKDDQTLVGDDFINFMPLFQCIEKVIELQ